MSVGEIRVMLADDHVLVRQGLVALLEKSRDFVVVAQAGDGREAVAAFRQHRPDVTLMDLRMPLLDGVEAIAEIRREFPRSRFIVLTTYSGDDDVYRAVQAGAQGYLLKGMSGEELDQAIRAVHGGRKWIPAELAGRATPRARAELTPRETDVLRLVVAGKSNKEIGAELDLQEATVKSYLTNVFGKLGVTSRTQAITAALQRGIVKL